MKRDRLRNIWWISVYWVPCWLCPVASAQRDSTHHVSTELRWMATAAAVVVSAREDERIAAFARGHQRASLDRVASVLDPFGRAGTIVPALAAAVLVPRLAGRREVSNAALRVALAYAAADGVEAILKPVIGRHRPDDGGAWRFHPFSGNGDWHSTPSAHTVHVFALATALDAETRSSWVAAPAYAVAALVGAERVYRGQHWSSDVVVSTALATTVTRLAERALRRHGVPHVLAPVH